jgi:WD40 repeat protein
LPAGDAPAQAAYGTKLAVDAPARPANHQPYEWPVSIAVSKDGSTAAASYREGTIWVWDSKTGKPICGWENNFKANLALSSDGKRMGLDADSGTVHGMMNPRTGQFLGAAVHSTNLYSQRAFSPDGGLCYAQAAQHGYILDGVTGAEQRHIEVNRGEQLMYSYPFELLTDGATCLILANDVRTPEVWGTRFELQWWNLRTGSLDHKLLLSKSGALYPQMAVSGDGKTVALRVIDQPGGRQPFIELRSAASGEVIGSLQDNSYDRNQQVEHIAFTNEDKTLTILNRAVRRTGEMLAARIEEWDVATHRKLRSQQMKLARIPKDMAIPVISGAANRLIYPAPRIGLTFLDLTTWKGVPPGAAETKP